MCSNKTFSVLLNWKKNAPIVCSFTVDVCFHFHEPVLTKAQQDWQPDKQCKLDSLKRSANSKYWNNGK